MTKKKRKWRTRTSGTSRQVGKKFVLDSESPQSKRANFPKPSIWIRANPFRRKSEEEKLAEEKRKRLKRFLEKKKREEKGEHLFGQPIPESEEPETIDEELRAEAEPVVVVVEEVKEDFKDDVHKLSNYLRKTRIGRFLEKKGEHK